MNKNSIYGAIIGDIAGSHLEVAEIIAKQNQTKREYADRIKILSPNTPIFTQDCSLTDDSVLTIAIADALLGNKDYEQKLKHYGKKEINMGLDKYGRSRFGKNFSEWIYNDIQGDSYGNGCAMRISAIGYAFDTLEQTLAESDKATIPSHNHPDSLACARAISGAIFMARNNFSKQEIKLFAEKTLGTSIDYDIEDLRHNYIFTSKAMNSVPQAIYCFFISDNFEQTLRNSLSIGGDVDTIGAIACSIASAYYDIPQGILNQAKQFISDEYDYILTQFSQKYLEVNNG